MTCLIVTSDLMLQSQVSQTAQAFGMTSRSLLSFRGLVEAAAEPAVQLVIVDLQAVPAEELAEVAEQLRGLAHSPLCLAVGPHVYKQLLEDGSNAGWTVLTRGQLHAQLAQRLQQFLA